MVLKGKDSQRPETKSPTKLGKTNADYEGKIRGPKERKGKRKNSGKKAMCGKEMQRGKLKKRQVRQGGDGKRMTRETV